MTLSSNSGEILQLFKSLFCLQGFDTRMRFFVICSSSFLLFILFSNALSQSPLTSLVITLILTGVIALTTQRRLRDAALNRNWILAPTVSFFIVGLIIIFSQHNSSYWLLLLPALCSAILLTYQSKLKNNSNRRSYILGYFGPIDLSEHQKNATPTRTRRRIEPSLHQGFQSFDEQLDDDLLQTNTEFEDRSFDDANIEQRAQSGVPTNKNTDIGEIIRLKLLSGKNAKITIYAGIALAFTAFTISFITSSFNNEKEAEPLAQETLTDVKQEGLVNLGREHKLNMPDAFFLYLTKYQGLIISWQADDVDSGTLWSQADIKGDKSCKNIAFTPKKNKNKDTFRPLTVQVENGSDYYATFSPLDTKDLVQSLAFRGKFSLCGYSFSLKGSQSALGKNQVYSDWVDY